MFNKKLFIFAIVLLFILQISFVNAQEDNDTEVINQTMDCPKFYNNGTLQNNANSSIVNESDKIEFNQGDIIPISINGPAEGNLKILVDNKEFRALNFSYDETIYIPTYNPESFFNSSIMNINPGLHNISLIFDLRSSFAYFMDIFIDKNSTLNLNFLPKFNVPVLNNIYSYNFTLNILKTKTIHITDFNFFNLCESGVYRVHLDNFNESDPSDTFGIIVSKNDEIIYKEPCSNVWVDYLLDDGLGAPEDVGYYNLTVVNLADGSIDYVIFKTIKYQPKLNISYIINQSTIIFHFINSMPTYWPFGYITLDNITNEFCMHDDEEGDGSVLDISFENLSVGVHTMKLYCPEYEIAEAFFHEVTFEIENNYFDFNEENQTIINQTNSNITNATNITIINVNSIGNTSNTYDGGGKNHNNLIKLINYNNKNSKKELMTPAIGDINDRTLSHDVSTQKSYEISKKFSLKTINDQVTGFALIIIAFISLLFGFFKFKKNIN